MMLAVLYILYGVFGYTISSQARLIGPAEYCNREKFNATCQEHEVVMIQNAQYGRMKIGRCVKLNLGYLGCAANVTTELASRCSGRRQCLVDVSDDLFYEKNPCTQETTLHLEVTYKCIKVVSTEPGSCHRHRPFIVKQQSGFLTTDPAERLRQGTHVCPWQISVEPGQNISLTLYSFVDRNSGGTCLKVANVHEGKNENKKIMACLSNIKKQEIVYTSHSNMIRIDILLANNKPPSAAFLIQFKANGCPNIIPNGSATVTYTSETAKVQCNHTGKVWYLTCRGTEWIGKTDACIRKGSKAGSFNSNDTLTTFPYGLLIAVAIGVALGVFCGGMLLTLVAVHNKRKKRREPSPEETVYYGTKQQQQAHQFHQHYEPAAHYCTEMSSLTRASNDPNTPPTLCPNHAHITSTTPDGGLEFREFCMKPDQQPDLFLLDKNCTLAKDRSKYQPDNVNNQNQSAVR